MKHSFLVAVVLFFAPASMAGESSVEVEVDWASYISDQDLRWDQLPQEWKESPFIGNGLIGSMMFQESPTSMVIQLGRSDVQDHRAQSGIEALGRILPDQSRMPIGYFTLDTQDDVTACDLRVNLFDAEISGTLSTAKGEIAIRAFVHADEMLLVVEAGSEGGAVPFEFTWHPEEAFCPRVKGRREGGRDYYPDYKANPLPVVDLSGEIKTCRHDLLAGGQTGTAWHVDIDGNKQTLLATVSHSYPATTAFDEAVQTIEAAKKVSMSELETTHRAWWNNFYPRSFVSLPDQRLNSFYWIQNYKMASATKGGYALADNQGPWLQPTGWPGLWWNLNVQLAYSHLLVANYPDLASGLVDRLYQNRENLAKNVPESMQHDSYAINTVSGQDMLSPMGDPNTKANLAAGNLLWAVHNTYMQYRHTMDEQLLEEKILPLLIGSVNFYFHFMIEGDDGRIHLPNTNSPEYGSTGSENCNYDLALLRWACGALIDIHETLNLDDPRIAKWQDVLDRLVDYPVDETGFKIDQNTPYAKSHRHYSHLLMIYPLYLFTADESSNRPLIKTSIDHWQSFPERLAGYSFTGSSSMYASLGLGTLAESRMQDFMNDKVLPNTFYAEGSPVIETPPAGARSIQDMLIQSWGDKIRVFPAIPRHWPEASFAGLSAEGGFLVSASRRGDQTDFVSIHSRAGEPCVVRTDMKGQPRVVGLDAAQVKNLGGGEFEITLEAGQTATLIREGYEGELTIKPVKLRQAKGWAWGLNGSR